MHVTLAHGRSDDVAAFLRPLLRLRVAGPADLATLYCGSFRCVRSLEGDGFVRLLRMEGRALVALGPRSRPLFPEASRSAFYDDVATAAAAYGWTRAALAAQHMRDGFVVDAGDTGRAELRRHLIARARERVAAFARDRSPRAGMAMHEAERAIVALEQHPALLPSSSTLPFDVAWRVDRDDLRVLFVEQPYVSLRRQLDELPLNTFGQPRVRIVIRPAEDGSVVDQEGTPLVRGARWRSLSRAFTPTTRPTAGFPLWTTADVVHYRPELFFRVMRQT